MAEQHNLLLESQAHPNPFEQFKQWFDAAQRSSPGEWFMAEAMSLSTADIKSGDVYSRMLLLKELDDKGFVFYTNYESNKGRQLNQNTQVSMLFYWPHLERQVRIEGAVIKVSREESAEYFKTRPRGSQLGAWASKQSQILNTRESLDRQYIDVEAQYKDKDVPLPSYWGGYRLLPVRLEFWQGRSNRLHDRLFYRKVSDSWVIERLSP